MTAFVLDVPLPTMAMAANGRVHHMRKAKEVDAYKQIVTPLAISRRNELRWVAPARARISLHYCTKRKVGDGRYRPHDWDNAVGAFKAGQDALVLAGVLVADDAAHLEGGSVTFDSKVGPWVRVTVEALG